LASIFAARPRDEWTGLFEGSDACVSPVLDPSEAARHPHMAVRGSWLTVDGVLQAAAAPRFSGWAQKTPGRSPARGEHDAEIRAALANPWAF